MYLIQSWNELARKLSIYFSVGAFTICLGQKSDYRLRLPKPWKVIRISRQQADSNNNNISTWLLTLRNFQFFEPYMTSFWWVVSPQSQFKQWKFLRCYTCLTHFTNLKTCRKTLALAPILILWPYYLVGVQRKCHRTINYHQKVIEVTFSYLKNWRTQ